MRIRYLATLWELKSLQVCLSFQLFFVDDIGNLDIYEMLRATLWKPFNAFEYRAKETIEPFIL